MDRHFVAGEIVVDEKAPVFVDDKFFHQRGPDTHRHGADHLAACRFRIEDAARRAHRKHALDADLPGRGIDFEFNEMRAEGRLLIFLIEIAIFDLVLGGKAAFAGRLGEPEN